MGTISGYYRSWMMLDYETATQKQALCSLRISKMLWTVSAFCKESALQPVGGALRAPKNKVYHRDHKYNASLVGTSGAVDYQWPESDKATLKKCN